MTTTKKKTIPFAAVTLAALIVFVSLLWGVSTGWGNVKIRRVTIHSTDGKAVSGVVYVPAGATNETPAPLVVNLHGRANSAHVCDSWALEEARRGYVAVSMDINGGGESDVDAPARQVFNYLNYLWDLPFVEARQTTLIGFSAGTGTGYSMISSEEKNLPYSEAIVGYDEAAGQPVRTKDNIALFIDCCAPKAFNYTEVDSTNICVIKAQQDEYNYGAFNYDLKQPYSLEAYNAPIEKAWAGELAAAGDTRVETGKYYGDWASRTGRVYYVAENTIHQTPDVSHNAIAPLLESLMAATDAPNAIDAHDQVWGWAQLFALLCAVTAMVLVIAVGKLLVDLPAFESVKNPLAENRGARGKAFWADLAVAVVMPAVLFIPLTVVYMKHIDGEWIQHVFKSTNLSAILFWLVCTNLITLAIMACKYRYKRARGGAAFDPADYALAAPGKKIGWKNVGKSLLIAVGTLAVILTWLDFSEKVFGVSYHFWIMANFESVSLARLWKAIPYMCVIFFILLVSGVAMNTGRRLPDTGSERRDMARNMALNAAVAALPVLILLVLQYGSCFLSGTGATLFPYGYTTGQSSMGALNYAWGFPFLMGSMAAINTYFYRKTGNVWTGALIGALLAGALAFNGQPWVA